MLPYYPDENMPLLPPRPRTSFKEALLRLLDGSSGVRRLLSYFQYFQLAKEMVIWALSYSRYKATVSYYMCFLQFYALRRIYGITVAVLVHTLEVWVPLSCIALACSAPFWTHASSARVLWILVPIFTLLLFHYALKHTIRWLDPYWRLRLTAGVRIKRQTALMDDEDAGVGAYWYRVASPSEQQARFLLIRLHDSWE